MDSKTDLVTDLLITNTILTSRLIRTVSVLLEMMREAVPDFEKRYIAALFPREEPEAAKLLEELAEKAQKLAQEFRH